MISWLTVRVDVVRMFFTSDLIGSLYNTLGKLENAAFFSTVRPTKLILRHSTVDEA